MKKYLNFLLFFISSFENKAHSMESFEEVNFMEKFVLIGKMTAKPQREQELEKVLQALSKGTFAEPRCIFYSLHRDLENPSIFVLIEGWASKNALQMHFTSPHFLEYFPQISSLIAKEPELTYLNPLGEEVKGTLFLSKI